MLRFFWKNFKPFPFCNSVRAADLHSEKLPLEWRVDTNLFFSVKEPGESFQDSTTCEYPLGVQGSLNIPFSRDSAAALLGKSKNLCQDIPFLKPIMIEWTGAYWSIQTNQRSYDYNQTTDKDSNFNNHYAWPNERKISYSLHQRWPSTPSPRTSRKKRNYTPTLCSCNNSKELNPQHSNL